VFDVRRIIVGVSGASGAAYGVRLLELLAGRGDVETHLIVSRAGEKTVFQETGLKLADLKQKAAVMHSVDAIGAPVASGSFLAAGMVIAPCSVHTMSAVASGNTSNLLTRAADVTLKERRPLILMIRESPLHLGHLRTMAALAEMGAIIAPPLPAFYHRPKSVDEIVTHSAQRVMDLLGLPLDESARWSGE
jgi:4-hydroxy-3-polyprenylbenzoate decarboxylase